MEEDTFENEAERDDMDDDDGEEIPRVPKNGASAAKHGGSKKASAAQKESDRKKRELISMGKAKGFLTYDEVNEHMPESILSSEQMDDWLSAFSGEGIEIVDEKSKIEVTGWARGTRTANATTSAARPRRTARKKKRRRATPRPTIPCASTCGAWGRSRCSRARARSRSPSASRTASGASCRWS